MARSQEAIKRAKEKYNKKVTKITVEFYPQETELLEKVKSQPSQQGYIKELIRKDIPLMDVFFSSYKVINRHLKVFC